ncbi:MAG: hypothetical protein GY717_16785 [Rhodobacteraceae bacterium]|nr:hypothetical protein [Paracoccaceae bacterium]
MTAASRKIVMPQSRTVEVAESFSRLAAVFVCVVCVVGEVVLAMWLEIIPSQWAPSLAGMTPIAALGTILAALGLLFFTFKHTRLLSRLICSFIALVGLLMLGQDLLGLDLGLDKVLIPPGTSLLAAAPGGHATSPGIIGALVLFGVALLYAKHSRPTLSIFSQVITQAILAQVLIVVAGHVYGVDRTDYLFPFMPLTVYGAISMVFLSFGLIAATPERGIAAAIIEQSPAGEMLRRLLPGILILPLVIGWVAHQGEAYAL